AADFPRVPDYRHALARSHNDLGWLLFQTGGPKDAEAAFRKAVDLEQKLADDFPNIREYRADLADSQTRLGRLLFEAGRPKEAEDGYSAAVAVQEKLVADFPGVPDCPNNLAGTLVNWAILKNAAREHARARELLEKARKYHRQALRAHPDNGT